ncbi:MAG: FGGY family carbohydrate kinase [Gammaproteobacteria bacterium]
MTYSNIIVIDQGTHSTRAIIYNCAGESLFKSQQKIDLFYRQSSQIEQDGPQILKSCEKVLQDAYNYVLEHQLSDIGVALTTQRSTVIAWDASTGDAISPALSWLDTRAQDRLENFSINESVVKEKTGLPLSAHYGASKLQWLLKNDANVKQAKQKKNLKYGPLASYLIFNLLKQQPSFVDYANAHRTLLWNLQSNDWDDDLLSAFSISKQDLPLPVPNTHHYGNLKISDYPMVLVNGDQNSAVYGYGDLNDQTTFINVGTGAFVLAQSKHVPVLNTKLLASITYSSDRQQEYALEGTVNGAGAAMSWVEDEWGVRGIESVPWKNVKDVPIFLNTIGGLGSPFWCSHVQPRFLDANKSFKDYSIEQCMAALMESIIFLLVINLHEMQRNSVKTNQLLIAGGMSRDEHLCQSLANLCAMTVTVSGFKEATSRGAAWLAMQRPEWELLESKEYLPKEDKKIHARFEQFVIAMNELVS